METSRRVSTATDLPEDVRKLVSEIETEIGEDHGVNGHDGTGVAASTDDDRTRAIVGTPSLRIPTGPVEAAVRPILVEIGEDPHPHALPATPHPLPPIHSPL